MTYVIFDFIVLCSLSLSRFPLCLVSKCMQKQHPKRAPPAPNPKENSIKRESKAGNLKYSGVGRSASEVVDT